MRIIYLILFISVFSCKKEITIKEAILNSKKPSEVFGTSDDSKIILEKLLAIELKQKRLIEEKDDRKELQQLIIEKTYYKETPFYNIDFRYLLLNEELNPIYANFNEYIQENYVDILGTEAEILKSKELLCDTIKHHKFRENRYIDYKVYNVNDQLISLLFYKENFYNGTLHPTYSFDCMNFDLNQGVFMNYEDFFIEGTEDEFAAILNEQITKEISSGAMYYDCWELSNDEFFDYKNNFVINDTYVEYYFDDCVMCPAYTGSYSIKIPVVNLLSVIKKYHTNPLVVL